MTLVIVGDLPATPLHSATMVKLRYFEYGFTSRSDKVRSEIMSNSKLENGALITRDAHVALAELKILVDWAAERLRTAERETVGVAIGHSRDENPLRTLQDAADALQSPKFEAAVSLAKEKMQSAVNWHLGLQSA
jgi:hypothetical protein